jgi:hypothetical protein
MYTTDASYCILVPPTDLYGIILHPLSITARVSGYQSIRNQSVKAWNYIKEASLDPMVNLGLDPQDMFVKVDLIDSLGKPVDDLIVHGLIENLDTEFSFLLEKSNKSAEFAVPLQSIEYYVGGNYIDVNRLTFTKSPCQQNYADLLRFRGRVIYTLELKLCTNKPVNLY